MHGWNDNLKFLHIGFLKVMYTVICVIYTFQVQTNANIHGRNQSAQLYATSATISGTNSVQELTLPHQ